MHTQHSQHIKPEDYDIPAIGRSIKVQHRDCLVSSSAAMQITHKPEGVQFYCYACKSKLFVRHDQTYSEYRQKLAQARQQEKQKADQKDWSLPADCSRDLPAAVLGWLATMHFGPSLIDKWKVQYSEALGRVILPLACGWQGKYLRYKEDKQPKYLLHSPDRYWNIYQHSIGPVVIVEDAYSAIRLSRFFNVCCLLGTPAKMPVVFKGNTEVLLWLDPDAAGQRAKRILKQELKYSCRVVDIQALPQEFSYYKQRDPKYYSDEELLWLKENIS